MLLPTSMHLQPQAPNLEGILTVAPATHLQLLTPTSPRPQQQYQQQTCQAIQTDIPFHLHNTLQR